MTWHHTRFANKGNKQQTKAGQFISNLLLVRRIGGPETKDLYRGKSD